VLCTEVAIQQIGSYLKDNS